MMFNEKHLFDKSLFWNKLFTKIFFSIKTNFMFNAFSLFSSNISGNIHQKFSNKI